MSLAYFDKTLCPILRPNYAQFYPLSPLLSIGTTPFPLSKKGNAMMTAYSNILKILDKFKHYDIKILHKRGGLAVMQFILI